MNFKNKIKDLKKHAKKMSLKKMRINEIIMLGIISSICFISLSSFILLTYTSLTTTQNILPSSIIAYLSLISALVYGWLAKMAVDDTKAEQYILSQKVILEFIESFPSEYHEQVKHHIADKMEEKKSFSLLDLKSLEKKLNIKTLKIMKESEIKLKENYNKIILEKPQEKVF